MNKRLIVLVAVIAGAAYLLLPANTFEFTSLLSEVEAVIIVGTIVAMVAVVARYITSNRAALAPSGLSAMSGGVPTADASSADAMMPDMPSIMLRFPSQSPMPIPVVKRGPGRPKKNGDAPAKKKFCGECGSPATTKFCGNCGAPIDRLSVDDTTVPQGQNTQTASTSQIASQVEAAPLPVGFSVCHKCNYGVYENQLLVLPIYKGADAFIQYLCPRCLTPEGEMVKIAVQFKPNPEVKARLERLLKDKTQGVGAIK